MMRFPLLMLLSLLMGSTALAVAINGAGSTFAAPIYLKWMTEFQKKHPGDQLNYQGIGSGAGIQQMIAGTVDFAGSDDPISAEDAAKTKPILHIPVAMGAIVLSYHLVGDPEIKLDGLTLAKIFDGRIKNWNDPAIATLNSGLKLPAQPIVVVTRSDSSGSTAVFTDFLAKVSPEWVKKKGKTVKWFEGTLGAKGNAGVAGLVKQTPGAIGYVELVYAAESQLHYAIIKNQRGQFVKASTETVSAAATGTLAEAIAKEFKISITDSAVKSAYPISAFTWILLYQTMPKEKGMAMQEFAQWAMSEEAQAMGNAMNYAPVPKDIRSQAIKALTKITFD